MTGQGEELQNVNRKLKIIRGKVQNSGKFRNNAINDAKQISSNGVIRVKIMNFLGALDIFI